jgi:hypothetical protein
MPHPVYCLYVYRSIICGKETLLCEHFDAYCCREIAALPKRDQHGNIVMAGRLVDVDASKFNYEDCLKSWFMLQDVTLLEHGAVPGFVFVLDMKGTSFGHITKMSLSSIKKYYMYIQVQSPNNLTLYQSIKFLSRPSVTHVTVMSSLCFQ